MNTKFDAVGIQTHDLQIMDNTLSVFETLVVTTEPLGTSLIEMYC